MSCFEPRGHPTGKLSVTFFDKKVSYSNADRHFKIKRNPAGRLLQQKEAYKQAVRHILGPDSILLDGCLSGFERPGGILWALMSWDERCILLVHVSHFQTKGYPTEA